MNRQGEPGAAGGRARVPWPHAPRYRIERANLGYRVVGDSVFLWEETLREAAECREQLADATAATAPGVAPAALSGPIVPEAVVYGPVASRRFGRSLGIDLMPPGRRACNFDCVYCELGRVPREGACGTGWPSLGDIRYALVRAFDTVGPIDSITISGHGEPTLHPRFAGAVAEILGEARRSRSAVPVRILTNGTLASRPAIRRALDQLDERIVVLDAAADRVNRPARGCPLGTAVAGMLLRDVSIQSCFIGGAVSNCDPSCVGAWSEAVAELRPRRVQIHTINRRPARPEIHPLVRAQLEEIACVLRARTGIEAEVYA